MKSRMVTIMLALFLGGLGIHQIYLGNNGSGLLRMFFCWTGIPVVLALIDAVKFMFQSDEQFNSKYNSGYEITYVKKAA